MLASAVETLGESTVLAGAHRIAPQQLSVEIRHEVSAPTYIFGHFPTHMRKSRRIDAHRLFSEV
jgi:hypothetical protein